MVEILNVFERSKALLAGQFQELPTNLPKTHLQSLIYALCTGGQDLQNTLQTMLTQRWLSTAVGDQLDGIGQILGLARKINQSDSDYREDLTFQIRINNGSGTPEQVIDAAKFFSDASKVWYEEVYPAAYLIATNGLQFPNPPVDLANAMQKISPAGVRFIGLVLTYNTVPFTFAGDSEVRPLYVAPDPDTPSIAVPLEMNTTDLLNVNVGFNAIPSFGGWFSELTDPIDTFGAGQFTELLPAG
jgi:hypothetical protein